MTRLAPLALALLCSSLAACVLAPEEAQRAQDEGDAQEPVAPVLLNIGIDQLRVARLVLDLDTEVARFIQPASELPLDRVQVLANGFAPEDLDHIIARCSELEGYEITRGDAFVVGQGEALLGADIGGGGTQCAVCGFAVICPGMCPALGPGEVPHDASSFDDDPRDDADANVTSGDGNGGDTGTDSGGDSGGDDGGGDGSGDSGSNAGNTSGGSAGDSGSGASDGGSGGSHGGVGNPGG